MTTESTASYRSTVLRLVVGAVIISFSPVFVKVADVEPTMAGFYRTLFGGIFLVVLAKSRGESFWKGWPAFRLAVLAAVLFAADLSFWHRAIHYIGPGLSTVMGNFQVFVLAIVGVLVFKERTDWRFLLSIPLALAGLLMIVGVDWSVLQPQYKLGIYFGLLTAVVYACYVLTLQRAQRLPKRMSAAANLAIISLLCAAILGVEGALQGESFRVPNTRSWVAMVAYGVLCQALGWVIISSALQHVAASRAGLILLLQPTLAFVWDIILFGRPTDAFDVTGAAIALTAIYLGSTRHRT